MQKPEPSAPYTGPPTYAPPTYTEAVGGVNQTLQPGPYYVPPQIPKGPPGPTIVTNLVPVGPNPTRMRCPHCLAEISTETKTEPGMIAYISGMIIAILGCWFGCCLIPCCINECLDVHHTCPQCKAYLGRYRR